MVETDSSRCAIILNKVVRELSDADDELGMFAQWDILYIRHVKNEPVRCVCTTKNYNHVFHMINLKNGNTLSPIGTKCIERFNNGIFRNLVKSLIKDVPTDKDFVGSDEYYDKLLSIHKNENENDRVCPSCLKIMNKVSFTLPGDPSKKYINRKGKKIIRPSYLIEGGLCQICSSVLSGEIILPKTKKSKPIYWIETQQIPTELNYIV